MPTDNPQELFYHVDDQDRVIGAVTRGEVHANPEILHRSVFVLVFNQAGELLLQKRSASKDKFPGCWTISASGHVDYGHSYAEAAARELEEELGLSLVLKPEQKVFLPEESEFAWIYSAKLADNQPINFDPTEISAVRFVAPSQLRQFQQNRPLTPGATRVLRSMNLL